MTDLNNLTFDQLVPKNSKFLSKEDVGEDGVILTIRGFKQEVLEQDDTQEEKVVMYFMEADYKPMILNRTNSQLVGVVTGVKTAGEAKGKKIVVYADPTIGYGGKITGGLRIKKIPGEPRNGGETEGPNDDIPF